MARMSASLPSFLLRAGIAALIGLLSILLLRAAFPKDHQMHPAACNSNEEVFIELTEGRVNRFKGMLRIPTISWSLHKYATDELIKLNEYLSAEYPLIHASPVIEFHQIANYSRLYIWKGTDPTLKAAMLASHLDVVPIANPEAWSHPPFQADEVDGYIYARGCLDDKFGVFAVMENMEALLQRHGPNFRPERTVVVAFGHDEEVGGLDGAGMIGKYLSERGIEIEFLLDEGLPISDGLIAGVERPVALIGVAEKGFLTLEMTAELPVDEAGHAARPPRTQAISVLARAIDRLTANPQPASLSQAVSDLFQHIAPEVDFGQRVILTNMWLLKPVLMYVLSLKPNTDTLIRTTTSFTILKGGIKSNVLPNKATVTINHRLNIGDTIESVIAHNKRVVNDERIHFHVVQGNNPSDVSNCEADGFKMVERSVRQVWPEYAVTPALMVAATDTKHYAHLTSNMYRFLPVKLNSKDINRIHGPDERIHRDDLAHVLNFYAHLFDNLQHFDPKTFTHHPETPEL
eukprot:TRINITY_DN6445_c0_g1_i3.p1 TRINITY_DN6445_c0_g1~~TRINITY_DN6445_c0_g1_i3.p1  ORF type:complete len:518 (+),score=129.73 TRINITY_DN6445_c0_g1_i3:116-1669(+)